MNPQPYHHHNQKQQQQQPKNMESTKKLKGPKPFGIFDLDDYSVDYELFSENYDLDKDERQEEEQQEQEEADDNPWRNEEQEDEEEQEEGDEASNSEFFAFNDLMNVDGSTKTWFVRNLLDQYPDFGGRTDVMGNTPLHAACANQASKEVLEVLIEKCPAAVTKEGRDQLLPLHCACSLQTSRHTCIECGLPWFTDPPAKDVIEFLLQLYPEAAQKKDVSGKLPLHYACSRQVSRDGMELLLQAYPNAVQETCAQGMLPLHYACSNIAPQDVIELLVKTYPTALQAKFHSGRLPFFALHTVGGNGVVQDHPVPTGRASHLYPSKR